MQPDQNPFRIAGPLRPGELFAGRGYEIEQILQALSRPQSVSIHGERRIGKTSLLFRLQAMFHENQISRPLPEFHTVQYLDFQTIHSQEVFFNLVSRQVGLEISGTLLDLEAGLEDKRPLLLMDEFDKTIQNPDFPADFFSVLRSWDNRGLIQMVIASRRPLGLYTMGDMLTSPFSNTFLSIKLARLTKAESLPLMERMGEIPPDWPDQIYNLTGGHPWRLQLFGYLAWEKLRAGRADFNTLEKDYRAALDRYTQTGSSSKSEEDRAGRENLDDTGKPRPFRLKVKEWFGGVSPIWIVVFTLLGSILGLGGLQSGSELLAWIGAVAILFALLFTLLR